MKFLMPHPVVAAVALCAMAMAPVSSSSAADVVVKPFDPMTLSDQIRDIWQKLQGSES